MLENNLKFVDNHFVYLQEQIDSINREFAFFEKFKKFLNSNYEKVVEIVGYEIVNINIAVKLDSIYISFKPNNELDLFKKKIEDLKYLSNIGNVVYVDDFFIKVEIL